MCIKIVHLYWGTPKVECYCEYWVAWSEFTEELTWCDFTEELVWSDFTEEFDVNRCTLKVCKVFVGFISIFRENSQDSREIVHRKAVGKM